MDNFKSDYTIILKEEPVWRHIEPKFIEPSDAAIKIDKFLTKSENRPNTRATGKVILDRNLEEKNIKKDEERVKNDKAPKKNTLLAFNLNESRMHDLGSMLRHTFVLGVVTLSSIVLPPILPSLYQKVLNDWQVSRRPETQLVSDQNSIPANVNPEEKVTQNSDYLTLGEDSLGSLKILTDKLQILVGRYSDITGEVSPSFVVANYDDRNDISSFSFYCDIDGGHTICFEYFVNDPEVFERLLNAENMQINNAINGFNNLLITKNLDGAITTPNLTMDGVKYTTGGFKEGVIRLADEDEYIEKETYKFTLFRTDGKSLYETHVEITQEDAQAMAGSSEIDLNALLEIYDPTSDAFMKSEFEHVLNPLSRIMVSANHQQNSNDLEK